MVSTVPFIHFCYLFRISIFRALNCRLRMKPVSLSSVSHTDLLLNKKYVTFVFAWLRRWKRQSLDLLQHVEEKGISKNVSQKSFLLSLPFLPSGREADLTAVCREEFLAILTYSYLSLGSMIFEYGDWFFLMGKNSSYPKLNMYISERKKRESDN